MNKITQYLLGAAALVIIITGLKLGAAMVNQLLFSILLAICIAPLPEWLSGRGLSKGLSMLVFFVITAAFGFLMTILLSHSISGLIGSIPAYEEKLKVIYNNMLQYAASKNLNVAEELNKVNANQGKFIEFAERIAGSVTGIISSILIVVVLAILFASAIVGYSVDTQQGKREQILLHDLFASLSGDVRKFVTITALKGVIKAVLNLILLFILGVDFAFLWAFISFFMNFIPTLGIIVSIALPALIALITLGPGIALMVLIGFFLINFIVEKIIGSMLMKQSLNISVLNTFLSLLVWGWILGIPGAILGVPLTMVVLKIHHEHRHK